MNAPNPATVAQPAGAAPVPSPCVNVCCMDPATGLCAGCMRTIDEIAGWAQMSETDKQDVWTALELRRATAELARTTGVTPRAMSARPAVAGAAGAAPVSLPVMAPCGAAAGAGCGGQQCREACPLSRVLVPAGPAGPAPAR